MSPSDVHTAERLVRRRARLLVLLAIAFMVSQAFYFEKMAQIGSLAGLGAVDGVQVAAWLVMAVAMLVLLFTGGGWFRSAAVRALINDEGTRDNRQRALAIAFGNTMAMGLTIYVLSLFKPVSAPAAVYLMMTVGIASALLAFGAAEHRALKGG